MVIVELKTYTKQIIFIDDFGTGVRTQHPDFSESSDKGYHFGYKGAVLDPGTGRERSRTLVKRIADLMVKLCGTVYAID